MPEDAPKHESPRVFVSYSHDSPEHADRVRALCDSLRGLGINVALDQYVHPAPGQGWPRWMDAQVDQADFVLMICTETYRRRVMGEEVDGVGLGVRWEGSLIYSRIYRDERSGTRFIPVLMDGGDPAHIPNPAQGHSFYRIGTLDLSDAGFEGLYRHLTGQARVIAGKMGERVTLARSGNAAVESPPGHAGREAAGAVRGAADGPADRGAGPAAAGLRERLARWARSPGARPILGVIAIGLLAAAFYRMGGFMDGGRDQAAAVADILCLENKKDEYTYCQNTRKKELTNYEDLLPILLQMGVPARDVSMDPVSRGWSKFDITSEKNPAILLIHQSAFADPEQPQESLRLDRLLKVMAENPALRTQFFIYSRALPSDEGELKRGEVEYVRRTSAKLQGRIHLIPISQRDYPDCPFQDPANIDRIQEAIRPHLVRTGSEAP